VCLLALAGGLVPACAQLLDIDGEYASQASGSGGANNNPGAGGQQTGGINVVEITGGNGRPDAAASGGGRAPESSGGTGHGAEGPGGSGGTGGTASSGGKSGDGDAATPSGTGGTGAGGKVPVADAGLPGCEPAVFGGTFKGMHSSAITVVGVPFQVTGQIRFHLDEGNDATHLVMSAGAITGNVLVGGAPVAPFGATLTGSFDCKTAKLTGALQNGGFRDPNAPDSLVPFAGTYAATLATDGFSGTWSETETYTTTTPPSTPYKGDGTFTAKVTP
jgi:hypothetical protein